MLQQELPYTSHLPQLDASPVLCQNQRRRAAALEAPLALLATGPSVARIQRVRHSSVESKNLVQLQTCPKSPYLVGYLQLSFPACPLDYTRKKALNLSNALTRRTQPLRECVVASLLCQPVRRHQSLLPSCCPSRWPPSLLTDVLTYAMLLAVAIAT